MTRRLELSFTNMSDRIKLFFEKKKKRWLEELIFWKYQSKYRNYFDDSKNWVFFFLKNMTHGTEPFFHVTHGIEPFFPTWLIVIEPFFFFDMTQRIEPYLEHDSKNWKIMIFFYWKNWIFFEYDSKNWTFFLNVTHRIELFYDSRIVFFFSEWQRFCWIRLKVSNLCLNMSQRIELLFIENMF